MLYIIIIIIIIIYNSNRQLLIVFSQSDGMALNISSHDFLRLLFEGKYYSKVFITLDSLLASKQCMIGTFNTFLGFPLCLKMITKTSQGYSTMLAFF